MNKKALVIGGGIAGITAARQIARHGYSVILVEKSNGLGGHMKDLVATFPELDDAGRVLATEVETLNGFSNVQQVLGGKVLSVNGQAGNFQVKINTPSGEITETVGSIVLATGFNYFDPSHYTEYGYGRFKNVVTSLEFEKILAENRLPKGSNGQSPVVVFVHCVGSRDRAKGYRYCSKICCTYSAKHAILLKQKDPQAGAYVFYIDIRAMGKGYEEFVRDAMEVHQVRYIRGRVAKVLENEGKLITRAEDSLIGNPVEIEADMVVLASAMEPQKDARELAEILGIATDEYGFFKEAQSNTHPARSSREGIFLAGSCTAPMEISNAVALGGAAASEAVLALAKES
ncbi:MAG: CoB--CoM heterodisulfide reductase iron-sulfur subunit A family protein [Thermincolia bacterium]